MKDRLYRYALAFLRKPDEAMDAVQEIYLRLWKGRDGWDKYENQEALAIKMMRNHCLDKLKSAQNRLKSTQEVPEQMQEQTPFHITSNKDSLGLIRKLMQKLPEAQSEIMYLRDVEEYEYEEISEITGMTVNYIRVNLSRARKKIRNEYQKIEEYELAGGR